MICAIINQKKLYDDYTIILTNSVHFQFLVVNVRLFLALLVMYFRISNQSLSLHLFSCVFYINIQLVIDTFLIFVNNIDIILILFMYLNCANVVFNFNIFILIIRIFFKNFSIFTLMHTNIIFN
jgi:hypothetical protein